MKNKIEIVDTAIMINNCTEDILIEGSQGQDLDINYGLDILMLQVECVVLVN